MFEVSKLEEHDPVSALQYAEHLKEVGKDSVVATNSENEPTSTVYVLTPVNPAAKIPVES